MGLEACLPCFLGVEFVYKLSLLNNNKNEKNKQLGDNLVQRVKELLVETSHVGGDHVDCFLIFNFLLPLTHHQLSHKKTM